MKDKKDYAALIWEMVTLARKRNRSLARGLPDKALTPGQKELKKKNGTPREFAVACVQALGEISVEEAIMAIKEYTDLWNKS